MAVAAKRESISYPSGEAIPINRIVAIQTDGQLDLADDATAKPQGVSQNAASAALQGVAVAVAGSDIKIEAGAVLDEGDLVQAVTGGRGSAFAAGGTGWVVGVCTQAASGSGAVGALIVQPQFFSPGPA